MFRAPGALYLYASAVDGSAGLDPRSLEHDTTDYQVTLASNLSAIHERVARVARRVGRHPDDITLMAVTKTFPAELIIEAYESGQRLFGENRVQEFAEKVSSLTDLRDAEFHMIGHLQSNKVGKAAALFPAIDSLDSARLAQRLNASADRLGKIINVLVEINLGGEKAKSGISPDSSELEDIFMGAPNWQHLRIRGLMTVPPFTEDPEGARPYFRRLRQLRDRLATRNLPSVTLDILSMGMSHDFEVAVEEGSTSVRIGSAIFGMRAKP